MARFVLLVNYDNGDVEEPTLSWDPAHIEAHPAPAAHRGPAGHGDEASA
jgi:hypothetical protein